MRLSTISDDRVHRIADRNRLAAALTPSSFAGAQRDPDVLVRARRRSFIAKLHSRPLISESSDSVPQTTSPVLSARAPLTESGESEGTTRGRAVSGVFVTKT